MEILLGPETPYVENLHPALEKKLSHPLFFGIFDPFFDRIFKCFRFDRRVFIEKRLDLDEKRSQLFRIDQTTFKH